MTNKHTEKRSIPTSSMKIQVKLWQLPTTNMLYNAYGGQCKHGYMVRMWKGSFGGRVWYSLQSEVTMSPNNSTSRWYWGKIKAYPHKSCTCSVITELLRLENEYSWCAYQQINDYTRCVVTTLWDISSLKGMNYMTMAPHRQGLKEFYEIEAG